MTQKFSCAPIANNRPWRAAVGRSSDDPNVFSHVQNQARIQDVEDVELPLHPEPVDAELLPQGERRPVSIGSGTSQGIGEFEPLTVESARGSGNCSG